jgi:hypothetical protein
MKFFLSDVYYAVRLSFNNDQIVAAIAKIPEHRHLQRMGLCLSTALSTVQGGVCVPGFY